MNEAATSETRDGADARLRVAAIRFLNPAPLVYDFEHAPRQQELARRYDVRSTSPAQCAEQLRSGQADLGLVPIAALPTLPNVVAVPGCVIASPGPVRSIQLVLRPGLRLQQVRSIAADAASRSSAAYVQVLMRKFHATAPRTAEIPADLHAMLAEHNAALLIGDPALLAIQDRDDRGSFAECTWIDVADWWRGHTGLPWVAAVWAVRTGALTRAVDAERLIRDLQASRDAGLAHVGELVREWTPRIGLPAQTIRHYLTQNIHYTLHEDYLHAIRLFFSLAEETGVLPKHHFEVLEQATLSR